MSSSVSPSALSLRGDSSHAEPSAPWDGQSEFANPFLRDRFTDVDPLVIEWARALCIDYGAKPDEMIGEPQYPRWRAWVGYAENASRAAVALGYTRAAS